MAFLASVCCDESDTPMLFSLLVDGMIEQRRTSLSFRFECNNRNRVIMRMAPFSNPSLISCPSRVL